MAVFKCKMCGGSLEISDGAKVTFCEYCGTQQTLPKTSDEVVANLFNRANNLRLKCEFDKAAMIYEKILEQDDSEAEAHWGLVLCKYGIEYVEDPKTHQRIPTCHRTLFDAVTADVDYQAAVDYSDPTQQQIYEKEARAIDKIQRDILAIVKNEKPFDVFLCYKETDDSGKRTVDSAIANDIYYQLTQEGFKVFYAAITLEDKLGQEYEPYIFAALNSAKVMLVLGTKPEYFSAVWVKNEWSRFLQLMKTDRSKLLIPCYRDMDAYDLPEEFAHLQAQDMSKIGFINDVTRGIKKVVSAEVSKSAAVAETPSTAGNANVAALLKRAFMFLEDGEFDRADDFCEQVLNQDPECAEAYLGKLMACLQVRVPDALKDHPVPFDGNNNYQKALRFADETLKTELVGYANYAKLRYENERKDAILADGKEKMLRETIASYESAIKLFESISGWKDADEQACVCRRKIDEIKGRQEAARLKRARQAEIARVKAQKRAKRITRTVVVMLSLFLMVIVFCIVLNTVIIPNAKYNEAIDLMDAGNIVEAYEALIALDGYRDSTEKANSIYNEYKLRQSKIGDILVLGAYEQDNNFSNGAEAIEWLVLDVKDGKALIVSKFALDCKHYNEENVSVTWETCSLRKWLNCDFIDGAFSEKERDMISTVTVPADKNPEYATDPGRATQDQVFLLSIPEVNKYFRSDSARQCKPTDYAVAKGAYVNSDNCWWWLRSPGCNQYRASNVYAGGNVGEYGYLVLASDGAVRPALWIDLNS